MKPLLFLLSFLSAIASAQIAVGDFVFTKKTTTTGPLSMIKLTPVNNQVIGFDNAGALVVKDGAASSWSDITGKPTTLSGFGITDAQPLDSDLTAIAALSTTSFGRSLLIPSDASAARATLELTKGSAVGNVPYFPNAVFSATQLAALNGGEIGSVTIGDGLLLNFDDPNKLKPDPAALSFNVRFYGATGDAQNVTDAVTTNTSTTVTSASATFTSADVGKVVYAAKESGTSPYGSDCLPVGTISSVTDAHTIVVSVAATADQTGASLVWGTDDTTACLAAVAAATSAGGGLVKFPAGGYIVRQRLLNSSTDAIGIAGDGSGNTILWMPPDFTMPGSGAANLIAGQPLSGFSVRGNWHGFTTAGAGALVASGDATDLFLCGQGFSTLLYSTLAQTRWEDCHAEKSTAYGMYVANTGRAWRCYAGNCAYRSFAIASVRGASNTGGHFNVMDCEIDESGAGALEIDNSDDVMVNHSTMYGPVGYYAAMLTTNSIATFVDCKIVDYDHSGGGNRGGLSVASGSKAYATATRFSGLGTLYAIDNAGHVYDGGNNQVEGTGLNGTAMEDASIAIRPVAAGGTGASTLTANNVILGNGTSAVQFVSPGTSGNVLTSNGTTWTSTTPSTGITINSTTTSGASSGDILTSDGTKLQKLTPGTGVTTALGNAVNASGGLLTYSLIGTSGTKVPLLDGANTWSAAQTVTLGTGSTALKLQPATDATATLQFNIAAGTKLGTIGTLSGNTTYIAFYGNNTPASTNYALATNGARTYVNAASGDTVNIAVADSARVTISSTQSTIKGDLVLDKTITAAGTTGAQTINKTTGSVNLAASATSLVVTNSLVTANSVIICTVATHDATCTTVQAVAASGSFTIYPNVAPTAETRVNFIVTN